MASIVCAVRVLQLVPCILYANALAPLLIVAARGMDEGLKEHVPYHITLTIAVMC